MNGQDDQNQSQGTPQPQPASTPLPQPAAYETPYVRPEPTVMPGELDTVKKGRDK